MVYGKPIAEFRASHGRGQPDPGSRTVRAQDGRYYSTNARNFPGVVSMWSARGEFLDALDIGTGSSSALAIYTDSHNQLHVRTPSAWKVFWPDFRLAAEYAPPVTGLRRSTIVLPHGGIVSSERKRGNSGAAFRVFDGLGALRGSIGPVVDFEPAVASAGHEQFWSGWVDGSEYVLGLFDLTGDVSCQWRGAVPEDMSEESRLSMLHLGEDRNLITVLVAGTATRGPDGRDESEVEVALMAVSADTGEVIDLKRGSAPEIRRLLPNGFFPRENLTYHLREDADGVFQQIIPYSIPLG